MPDLINLFLPGFLFIQIYGWLNAKHYNISLILLWSLFISYMIIATYTAGHALIFTNYKIYAPLKSLIYLTTGVILPFIVIQIRKTKLFGMILQKSNQKSINTDIFNEMIDYHKATYMYVYLKSSHIYYVGTFRFREEKGHDSYIGLINYAVMSVDSNKLIYSPKDDNHKSTAIINLQDVERIECIYDDNSKVWKRLIKN